MMALATLVEDWHPVATLWPGRIIFTLYHPFKVMTLGAPCPHMDKTVGVGGVFLLMMASASVVGEMVS